jgi:hypothetical protein
VLKGTETRGVVVSKKPAKDALADRLDCYGKYDKNDPICSGGCSLALICAVARNEYLDGQALEGDHRSLPAHHQLSRR